MAKYRRLPIEVDAIVWDGDQDVMNAFMGLTDDPDTANHAFDGDSGRMFVCTGDTTTIARPGDYVVKAGDEFYPSKPGDFSKNYEAVTVQE